MGSFGGVIVIVFVISVLFTLTMNAVLRGSVAGMLAAGGLWVLSLVAWIIKHKLSEREREQLEEELRRESAADA
jgi:membrane associated rhomboid family serine protease